jgi:hypothetical protein
MKAARSGAARSGNGDNTMPTIRPQKYWIGVVSRQHVLRGAAGGFAQVCHGKGGPLRSMKEGDWLVYYSPVEVMGEAAPCKRFTAIGRVLAGEPYLFDMGNGFVPYRRDIAFLTSREADIRPLIPDLGFILNKKSWGYPFRRGCFAVPRADFVRIATAMGVAVPEADNGDGQRTLFAA